MKTIIVNKEKYEIPEAVYDLINGFTAEVEQAKAMLTREGLLSVHTENKTLKTVIKEVNAINLTGQSQMCCVGLLHTIKKILGEIK